VHGLPCRDIDERRWRNADECSNEEMSEWNVDDWRRDVNEPIRQKWSDSQEDDVGKKIMTLAIDVLTPFLHSGREIAIHNGSPDE